MAAVPAPLKVGTLRKLGGKDKDKWEPSVFELSTRGITWESKLAQKQIALQVSIQS